MLEIPVVVLDVGGVLLLPDCRVVGPSLMHLGVTLNAADAARAHYAGVAAFDREPPDRDIGYLDAYSTAAGVRSADRDRAIAALEPLWGRPSPELWSQVVEGARDCLFSLSEAATGSG